MDILLQVVLVDMVVEVMVEEVQHLLVEFLKD